jgi:hypothetical protein
VKGARVELVLDPEGAPVGGAEALTDESGTAEIRGLEASACAVDVTADGFAPSRVVVDQFPAADMTSSAPVVLSRTRTVVCRITARGGELPAGIAAFVAYENGSGGSQGGWWVPVCRDGLLRAAVPAEGPVKVLVAAPGFRTADLDASADVEEFAVDLVPQKK